MEKNKLIIVVTVLCYVVFTSGCNFMITIQQGLEMDGFHRNMTYNISLVTYNDDVPKLDHYKDCYISIHQTLPPGVYVNVDELKDLRRSHKLNSITTKTNVELPTHMAETGLVYMFEQIHQSPIQLWLPVHARYHKAVRFGGYALNTIRDPVLYMRCPADILEKCDKTIVSTNFICTTGTREQCEWKKIPFIISTESPIIWRTPIGDLNHYNTVSVITSLTVIIGSIYLMFTLHSTKLKYAT